MTATMPAPDLRVCRLYRFYVEHPITGQEVLGYIGETIREAITRLLEHLRDKPWFDTVVRWVRDPRVFGSKAEVQEAEKAAIEDEEPLYNVEHNQRNKARIIPPVAVRQRRERDVRAGEPRWVHPNDPPLSEQGPIRLRSYAPPKPVMPSWQARTYRFAIVWALLCSSSAVWLSRRGLSVVWWQNLLAAALVSAGLLAWGVWREPDSWALWSGRATRLFRFLFGKPKRRRRR